MSKRTTRDGAITWLHLSDLHFCPTRSGYDANKVLNTLLTDLREVEGRVGRSPDFIFFTGDLAFGELDARATPMSSQFRGGLKFLESVRRSFRNVPRRENVFLVPGNHDVVRSRVTNDQVSWLQDSRKADDIIALIKEGGLQWRRYMDRLKAFGDALARAGYGHLLRDRRRLVYSAVRHIRGLRVGIAGFNSAWSSSRDAEKGRLWFGGRWQLPHLRSQLGNVDLSIALVHHPFNWLHEKEGDHELWQVSERDYDLLLHGHEHSEWVRCIDQRHVRVAAAACYDRTDRKNGYNFGAFEPASRTIRLWLRRYDQGGGGWIPNIVKGRTDEGGVWSGGVGVTDHQRPPAKSGQTAKGVSTKAPAPIRLPRSKYDVFFASPMAALTPAEYGAHQADAKRIVTLLQNHCELPKVFHPGAQIRSSAEFDPPDLAVRRGLVAITKSRLFMMLYSTDTPSSILVEAGFALALQIPSLYFVRTGLKLPFLLRAAQQAFPDVRVYDFLSIDEVSRYLKRDGRQICSELLANARKVRRPSGLDGIVEP